MKVQVTGNTEADVDEKNSATSTSTPTSTTTTTPSSTTQMVPQLEAYNVSYAELATAIKVLDAVAKLDPGRTKRHSKRKIPKCTGQDTVSGGIKKDDAIDICNDNNKEQEEDGLTNYQHANLRPLRTALAACLKLHQRTMYNGQTEEAYYEQRLQERSLKRQRKAEKDLQRNYIAMTKLRKGRVERLQALQNDAEGEEKGKLITVQSLMIPDGHVDTTIMNHNICLENGAVPEESVKLPLLRSCYVCKIRYRDMHPFYDQLCPTCAALNWQKRMQTVNLTGRVAVVTGSRVKIGYQVCLKLLRAGCTVVATSRFPNAAVDAYRKEIDFVTFQHRLHVYGLDLRDVAGLEAFVRFLKQYYAMTGIDILINNACQTIRRPAGYYRPLMEREQTLWRQADQVHKTILHGCREFEKLRRRIVLDQKQQNTTTAKSSPQLLPEPTVHHVEEKPNETIVDNDKHELVSLSTAVVQDSAVVPFETTGLSHSAAMSQMIILPEDVGVNDDILPPGISDVQGNQIDLRTTNSWLLKMEEVSTPELMECMFINAIAPFVLSSRLKPLMTVPIKRPDRYIINVSAMEGKFYRYKTECHPHTNMAKAALNMLTRTSADNLAKTHRIFMNSVDTGWINDENPLERASKTAKKNHFQTPIDEIDAASRILDPIFTGVQSGPDEEKVFGKFLKDYRESEW